ncbi:DUF2334 domain-containing protein [Chloroflexi bacterium TSY]|nr:DUF2334 domain-containing protein [Chloroflexi bacterium TSY]
MTNYVWSIDDAGAGGGEMVESLRRASQFFTSRGLESTWFTVPKAGDKPLSAEWKEALIAARDAGHDLQLHGLTHADCYEFGPPAWPATTILPTLQSEFDQRRDELMPRYTVANLRARMEEGMEIFARELGVEPTVFRAPCGAISKPMFAALREVGIGYHTCMYISGTGYAHLPHNSGELTQEWVDEIPHQPYRWYDDIIEVPILNEYTWRGAGQRSAEFIELAKKDLDRISQKSPIVVILMHTHGIADDYDHTFRLIDAVVEHVGQQPNASFATMGELAASGALTEAATVEGPDILAV